MAEAHRVRGDILLAEGKQKEALAEYEKAVSTGYRDADLFVSLGYLCKEGEKDIASAACYFFMAGQLNPKHKGFSLSLAAWVRGNAEKSRALCGGIERALVEMTT